MSKKTTWSDINKPECEEKPHMVYSCFSEHGKSTVKIDCPFCKNRIVAYIWSLRGCGKRCYCGALHGSSGVSYKLKEVKK